MMIEKLERYEIVEEIGQGGFAIVYRARDMELDRLVALKALKPVLLQNRDWIRRFRREARTIARLDHPHIVPIYDVYESIQRLFIVMRLIDGPSVEERLAERGRLVWAEAAAIITAVAQGLDYAHTQGIMHRDLKPANILLDPDRGAMLTDFGMAKLVGEASTHVTAAGGVIGTSHYIAPEIWEGTGTTPQSDIYALGCILYELLTGEKLFQGESPPAVMMAHFKPPSLARTWPEATPPGIAAVLETALARNPNERYRTAGALARAVAALRPGEPAASEPANGIPPGNQSPPTRPEPVSDGDESGVSEAAFFEDLAAGADSVAEAASPAAEPSAKKWRGFLAHLGPYVIVISMLAALNFITDPGGYPWFIWPALGWGVGLAFHLFGIIVGEMKNLSDQWRDFVGHLGSYAIIMGLLISIYLMTDPGGYPWFIWPALGWGAAVAIHLWRIFLDKENHRKAPDAGTQHRTRRQTARRHRRAQRQESRPPVTPPAQPQIANQMIQAHLDKAHSYRQQIAGLIEATGNRRIHRRLQDLADQVRDWTQAIEALAHRIDSFQQNRLIRQDLESVPQAIAKLERQLAGETDAATRTELERTLHNRKNQLAVLQHLQSTMKRAEIKIESTLSSLGTIYSQMLISQSTDHVADYSRLSEQVDEEVRTLQDHLEALEEVKLGVL